MKKYDKIPRIGQDSAKGILTQPVDVIEKMDGANFRFTHSDFVEGVDDDRIVFGSKNVIYKNEKDTANAFEHAVEYVRDGVDAETMRALGPVTVFAEAMHPHTLDYEWDDVPNVLVFDAYHADEGWGEWSNVVGAADYLGLPTAPVIKRETTVSDPTEYDELESAYNNIAEGVVFRRGEKRAKYRTETFLDRHGGSSRSSGDGWSSDTEELAHELLSKEPWVQKWIHKYRDRGRDIEMAIMEDLWRDVFDDIIEEEYETILLGDWDINTKDFRSTIASHTADELRNYLRRPDDSVLNDAVS